MISWLKSWWCAYVHKSMTIAPIYHSWRCRCNVCGHEWIEED